MNVKSQGGKRSAEHVVKDIRRASRRHFSAEDKSGLCWTASAAKEFSEAGKRRLAGDTARAATSGEVQDLRREATALKEVVADLTLENRLLKKSMSGDGEDEA